MLIHDENIIHGNGFYIARFQREKSWHFDDQTRKLKNSGESKQ